MPASTTSLNVTAQGVYTSILELSVSTAPFGVVAPPFPKTKHTRGLGSSYMNKFSSLPEHECPKGTSYMLVCFRMCCGGGVCGGCTVPPHGRHRCTLFLVKMVENFCHVPLGTGVSLSPHPFVIFEIFVKKIPPFFKVSERRFILFLFFFSSSLKLFQYQKMSVVPVCGSHYLQFSLMCSVRQGVRFALTTSPSLFFFIVSCFLVAAQSFYFSSFFTRSKAGVRGMF